MRQSDMLRCVRPSPVFSVHGMRLAKSGISAAAAGCGQLGRTAAAEWVDYTE
jgi:hypothetical protein